MASHRSDIAALALFAFGAISLLGIVADLTGPVGRGLRDAIGFAVGVFRFLVPVMCVWWAVSLTRGERSERNVGLGIGLGILTLSGAGAAHLARGPASVDASVAELRRGGGLIGAAIAEPLQALTATSGAWVVLGIAGCFSLLLIFDVPLAFVAKSVGTTAGTGVRRMGEWIRSLVSVGEVSGRDPVLNLVSDEAVIDLTHDRNDGDDLEISASADASSLVSHEATDPKVNVPTGPVNKGTQLEMDLGSEAKGPWKLPKMSVLGRSSAQSVDERAVHAGGHALEHTLASHGVETKVVAMTVGPTVTRYELELAPGVKVAKVTSLHKDIAYAMATPDVRILAPIPGRSAIGVEVPNSVRHLVGLGDILSTSVARESVHPLEVALGQDIAGRPVMVNLATMPHVLIAGATGAGKSSCINSILISLLMRATPDQVRLILVDPKRVEMRQYDRLPHLLTQVVTNPKKAANALAWAVKEMENRYDLLSEVGFRDITGYNDAFDRGQIESGPFEERTFERMPFIVIVVDELNDLMMIAARDVEDSITRLAQMARAVGIHLVVATQRPSVNVITGIIKANIPSRMAFAVSSLADSRVILDQPGAERLIGQGDMLLVTASSNVAKRIQGCWVTEAEVAKVVAAWRRQAPDVSYVPGIEGDKSDNTGALLPGGTTGDDSDDALLLKAMELVVENQLGSTSMLQRKLKVGFARAGRLMDLLEQRGVVGPSIGSKARDVLMAPEELAELFETQSNSAG